MQGMCVNNVFMVQELILKKLAENKQNQKIGNELFVTPLEQQNIKPGKSLKVIIKAMEKASKEQLLRMSDDVSYC